MRSIVTPDDVRKLGNIMSIWAHPDDESFSCAGLMALAISNGQDVVCITATKGEAGVQDESRWPAAQLAEIRTKELKTALGILGISHHHWLSYLDGCCCDEPISEAGELLKTYINKYKPDTILTFGPDGITGHPDHVSVSKWVDYATRDIGISVFHAVQDKQTYEDYLVEADKKFNIYFNIDKPPIMDITDCEIGLEVPDDIIIKKYEALKAMPSQTEKMLSLSSSDTIKALLRYECFTSAK